MEELLPFLFFIVIALVQVAKFFMEKGAKARKASTPVDGAAPERKPSAFEQFFEDLAEKMEPQSQPTPLPDWPENLEQPDYLQEIDDFQTEQNVPFEPTAEIIPTPEPAIQEVKLAQKPATVLAPVQVSSSAFSGSSRMRIPSVPMMRSNSSGHINVDLTDRKKLKQALIASLIFSPPRAYDQSFDTTLAK